MTPSFPQCRATLETYHASRRVLFVDYKDELCLTVRALEYAGCIRPTHVQQPILVLYRYLNLCTFFIYCFERVLYRADKIHQPVTPIGACVTRMPSGIPFVFVAKLVCHCNNRLSQGNKILWFHCVIQPKFDTSHPLLRFVSSCVCGFTVTFLGENRHGIRIVTNPPFLS